MEEHKIERAVLAGLAANCFTKEQQATENSLDELEALLQTAGGTCVAKVLQTRPAPDPHSFVGQGKAEEIRDLAHNLEADMVVFDNELSPSQIRALEDVTGCTVLDRSALILDIFAQRAQTAEGRLQVELAQYRYLLPKLSGMGKSMSRLGGGIGTRGPGETKLETDRRHIRTRIDRLQAELAQVRKLRAVERKRRVKNEIPVVAIVGYTNAGKSTLLNLLTQADIPANNRLFDTLDTTTRQWEVTEHLSVLLSDTVGFIAKLPHHLVEAFKATLEELEYADLLLHVIDAADSDRDDEIAVVDKLIGELARPETPVIRVYNKCDLADVSDLPHGERTVAISAKTGAGIAELRAAIEKELSRRIRHAVFCLPYSMGGQVERLHDQADVLRVDYTAEGIEIEVNCDEAIYGSLQRYEVT